MEKHRVLELFAGADDLPVAVRISERTQGWYESEVQALVDRLAQEESDMNNDDVTFSAAIDAIPHPWQRMTTAPKDGTAVLVLLCGSDIPNALRWLESCDDRGRETTGWHMTWDGHRITRADGPRYWMPIPEDPDAMR
jgi:hypothetical protein